MKLSRVGRLLSCVAVLGLTGCGLRDALNGGPRISDQAWLTTGKAAAEAKKEDVSPPAYLPSECKSNNIDSEPNDANGLPTPAKTAEINACVNAMVLLINIRWYHFAANVESYTNGMNFALDLGSVGLNAAGAFASGGTSKVLSAIAGGLTSSKTAIDSDLLQKHAVNDLLQQMTADRNGVYNIILARLDAKPSSASTPSENPPVAAAQPEAESPNGKKQAKAADDKSGVKSETDTSDPQPYTSMKEAAIDLYDFAEAGTWMHAMVAMDTATAASAQACKNAVAETKKGKATGKKSASSIGAASTNPSCTNASSTGSGDAPSTGTPTAANDAGAIAKAHVSNKVPKKDLPAALAEADARAHAKVMNERKSTAVAAGEAADEVIRAHNTDADGNPTEKAIETGLRTKREIMHNLGEKG